MVLNDTIFAYTLIARVVAESKDLIFKINNRSALMLDELYAETIQFTKKLKPFIESLENKETEWEGSVDYFVFDADFNTKEELHVLQIKKAEQRFKRSQSMPSPQPEKPQKKTQGSSIADLDKDTMMFDVFDLVNTEAPLHKSKTSIIKEVETREQKVIGARKSPNRKKGDRMEVYLKSPDSGSNDIDLLQGDFMNDNVGTSKRFGNDSKKSKKETMLNDILLLRKQSDGVSLIGNS